VYPTKYTVIASKPYRGHTITKLHPDTYPPTQHLWEVAGPKVTGTFSTLSGAMSRIQSATREA
jgi:hypothetical protein